MLYRVPLKKNWDYEQSVAEALRSVLVGRSGYLGPLLCNFFRKNNFEGTFLSDELAQWEFWVSEWNRFTKSRNCFFSWLPSFAIVCQLWCGFLWLLQIENTPDYLFHRKITVAITKLAFTAFWCFENVHKVMQIQQVYRVPWGCCYY